MGNFLHTLGVYAYEHKWRVISAWVIVLIGLGIAAATFITPTNQSISIPGTQAQTAIDKLGTQFPDAGKGSGRVVIHANDKSIQDYGDTITAITDSIKGVEGVSGAVSPLQYPAAISSDGRTAYIQVQLENSSGEVTDQTRDAITDITSKAVQPGLEIERGGDLVNKAPGEILGISEVFGLVIALVVLLMTLGSLVSAGMPVLTAIVAVGASMAGLFGLSQVVDINATTPALAVVQFRSIIVACRGRILLVLGDNIAWSQTALLRLIRPFLVSLDDARLQGEIYSGVPTAVVLFSGSVRSSAALVFVVFYHRVR